MQIGGLGCGDDESGGAGRFGARQMHIHGGAKGAGHGGHRISGLGRGHFGKPAAEDADAKAGRAFHHFGKYEIGIA